MKPLYCSRFKRNLNSVIRRLSKAEGPDVVFVEKRNGGPGFVFLSAKYFRTLNELKSSFLCSAGSSVRVEELEYVVPIHKGELTSYVRIIDIPNPWRSEFVADSVGSTCPVIPGEGQCHYPWDWQKWLSFRLKSGYQPRFDEQVLYISDEQASTPVRQSNGSELTKGIKE